MVTFYRPATRGAREALGSVVWNPQANAPLADFTLAGGRFDTDDPRVVSRLRELGYPEVSKPLEAPLAADQLKFPAGKVGRLKTRKLASPAPADDNIDSDVPPR